MQLLFPRSLSGLVTPSSALPGPQSTNLKRQHSAPSVAMDNVNGRVVKTRRAVHEIVVACLRRVRADRELSHVQQKGLPCAAFSVNQNDYHHPTSFDASVNATHTARGRRSLKNLRREIQRNRKVTDFVSTNVGHHRMMEQPNKYLVDRMTSFACIPFLPSWSTAQ